MAFAFLPELAAAVIGLAAVWAGDQIQMAFNQRGRCGESRGKTFAWFYNPLRSVPRDFLSEERVGAWTPIHRSGSC